MKVVAAFSMKKKKRDSQNFHVLHNDISFQLKGDQMYYFTIIGITESTGVSMTPSPPLQTEIRIMSDSFDNALGKAEAIVPGCDRYLVAVVSEKTD